MKREVKGIPELESFISLIHRFHKQVIRKEALKPLFLGLIILFFSFSVLLILELFFYLPAALRSLFWLAAAIGAMVAGIGSARRISPPLFRPFYEDILSTTGQEKLLNAVDLHVSTREKTAFTGIAIRENIATVDLAKAESQVEDYLKNHERNRLFNRLAGALAVALIFAGLLSLLFPGTAGRVVTFWKEYVQPNPYHYLVTPGDTTAVHGSVLQAEITFPSPPYPDQLAIHFKTDVENNFRMRNLVNRGSRTYTTRELELSNNLQYYFEMDGFASDTFYVDVQQQPGFERLVTSVIPPRYTGLPETRLIYPSTELSFYPGSTIRSEAVPSKSVDFIRAEFVSGNDPITLTQDEEQEAVYQMEFIPLQSDTLRYVISDREGLFSSNPYRTTLNMREDMPPVVVITEPSSHLQTNTPSWVNLQYEVTDDFGVTRAEIQWELRRAFTEGAEAGSVPLDTPVSGSSQQFSWNVEEFDLRPRDVLTFQIRAWDNDEISGYKPGESREIMIQIPSLTEFLDELDHQEEQVSDHLNSISQQFEAMEQDYQRFLDRLRQNPEGGFEESQMLENIREYQEDIEETVRELQEQFETLRSQMESSDQISEETRNSYRELQQLMDELDDPELRRAMEELRRAMESLSADQIEQALQNVSFNEQLYKERIERTIELFKQLQVNSRLENLAQRYEEMAERVNPESLPEISRFRDELESVAEDLNSAEEQLRELDKNPPQRSASQIENIRERAEENLSSIRDELQDLQEELETPADGDPPPSQSTSQKRKSLSEKLQQDAQNFRSAISEMGSQQLQVNLTALQRVLYTLLEISELQELLAGNTQFIRSQSQGFVELARLQDNLRRQFSSVSDTLFQISAELPGVPNQINKKKLDVERTLQGAVNQMSDRNQRGALIASRESLGGVNDLASMVASLIDQLMNQQNNGGGGGMSLQQMVDQLQDMSGDQQQLNQQLQNMVNDIQGDRLTQEQSERLDQMARQQNEIRRQLQELRNESALSQRDRVFSDLQRMLDEMEESIMDLRGGVTDPLMVERQQNILSRMLSASESLQQRGEQDEREGTPSLDFERIPPPEITLEELEQQIRARLQDPDYTSFSEEYRRIIERYFEELKKRDINF